MDKSDRIPLDSAAAERDDAGLLAGLRLTVGHLCTRFARGRGVVHILPVVRPFRTDPIPHLHPHVEVFLQVSGAGEMELVDGRQRFCAGDMVLVPRGVAHQEHPDSQGGPFWNFVLTYQDDSFGFHLAGGTAVRGTRIRRRCGVPTPAAARLSRYLHEAVAAVGDGRTADHPLVQALVLAHLALLADVLDAQTSESASADPLVAHARVLIAQYLSDPRLSVAWLARRLGCSGDHLSRRFHAQTGTPPVRAITRQRLALSCQLLCDPTLGIGEVARACGIADAAYFSRIFTAAYGTSPRAWRRQHAG